MPQFQTFKDLNVTFKPHPVTGDLIVSKDVAAVKQAIINLPGFYPVLPEFYPNFCFT